MSTEEWGLNWAAWSEQPSNPRLKRCRFDYQTADNDQCYTTLHHCTLSTVHTHTHTLPFYGPLSGTTQVCRYQKRHTPTHTWNMLWKSVIILDFMRRGEDNRGKCADNPAGRHLIRTTDASTSIISQFYAGCPSCCNPLNLSWLGTGTKYAGLHT